MRYQHLSYRQRCHVQAFWATGYSRKAIAQEMGVHPSTISRELRRNTRWNGMYSASQGDANYIMRREKCRRANTFTASVKAIVTEKLLLDWSPEQISGFGKRHGLFSISHERIYQYVLADKKAGGTLYTHLRQGRKRYRRRYGHGRRKSPIKNRVFIDLRPSMVESKTRIGDWEIDTIVGRQHQKAIVTIVDRASKKTLIGQVGTKHAGYVTDQTLQLLTTHPVATITADNGTEFAYHERITAQLGATVYFAHPYHSWERGLNEHTNGLIRQYIPKKTDFNTVTPAHIAFIQDRLNNRPCKSLDYATPHEVFSALLRAA